MTGTTSFVMRDSAEVAERHEQHCTPYLCIPGSASSSPSAGDQMWELAVSDYTSHEMTYSFKPVGELHLSFKIGFRHGWSFETGEAERVR